MVNIRNAESCLVSIDAPKSTVSLTLKSVHDSGMVRCHNLELFLSEEVAAKVNVVDSNTL